MATPVVPNQFAVGKNQIIQDAGDVLYARSDGGRNTGGRCAGVPASRFPRLPRESNDLLTANLIVHHVKNW